MLTTAHSSQPHQANSALTQASHSSTQDNATHKRKQEATSNLSSATRVKHWAVHHTWPAEAMQTPLSRRPSSASIKRTKSDQTLSSVTSSDEKSTIYQRSSYEMLLQTHDVYMAKDAQGPNEKSKTMMRDFMQHNRSIPGPTLFDDASFDTICSEVRVRNEARIARDITPLICPSPTSPFLRDIQSVTLLAESVNDRWSSCLPVVRRPQPDQAVAFGMSAFTSQQLQKLNPNANALTPVSQFMATWYMYFPFLAAEAKCATPGIEIADRQNATSMSLAVRQVVDLFRLAGRERELDREILAFSISHDHQTVRIHGHYPIMSDRIRYHRYCNAFDFTAMDGKDRWTAYRFVTAIYQFWVPMHHKRICSVIDSLPVTTFPYPTSSQGTGSVANSENEEASPAITEISPATSFSQQLDLDQTPQAKRSREHSSS